MKISLPLLAPLMIITCPFSAQVGKEKTVDQKEIKLLVDSLTSVLNHHYIYPEKALMYSKILNANYKSGLYNICETRPKLVNIIHDDLQETNKDMHLRIGYFPN